MNKSNILFYFEGNKVFDVANEIKEIIEDEFETQLEIFHTVKCGSGEVVKEIDPFATATLIISIPAAILASKDLLERITKKKKFEKILKEYKRIIKEKKEVNIKITCPDGITKEISQVNSSEIIETIKN